MSSQYSWQTLIKKLENLLSFKNGGIIGKMGAKEFLRVWNLIHLLHPTLHPEAALNKSGDVYMPPSETSHIVAPYYKRTGWPLSLIPIALEANIRFNNKELTEEDYYFNNLS